MVKNQIFDSGVGVRVSTKKHEVIFQIAAQNIKNYEFCHDCLVFIEDISTLPNPLFYTLQ